MPILIPIQGDSAVPFYTRLFAAELSVDVSNAIPDPAELSLSVRNEFQLVGAYSIDIESGETDVALFSLDINNSAPNSFSPAEGSCEIVQGDSFLIMVDAIALNLSAGTLR